MLLCFFLLKRIRFCIKALLHHIAYIYIMNPKNDHLYPIALKLGKGVGSVLYKKIIDKFGSAKNVFCTKSEHLYKGEKRGFDLSVLLKEKEDLLTSAQRFWQIHQSKGIQILSYGEKGYPERLAQLHAPPPLLYYKGSTSLNAKHIVSIVGTRHPTNYGKEVTKALVGQLKPYDALIVSGLAYGIDITAHKQALAHDIPTIAVMPGGLNMIYPTEHLQIAQTMANTKGGLISEYSFGTKPTQHQFPARNKIIAGIADATIVIEAPHKSGALITAYHANEFNREIFAVPGSIQADNSQGCHNLIKKHEAHLLTHIDDLAHVMNWSQEEAKKPSYHNYPTLNLSPQEEKMVNFLKNKPKKMATIDMLSTTLHLPLEKITSMALSLELEGIINVIGNQYQLNS